MSSRNLPIRRGGGRIPERGRTRLAARRRKMRALIFSVCLIMGVSGVIGLGALSHHEAFAVSEVRVSGVEALSPDTLEVAVEGVLYDGAYHFFSRANMFLYPKREIETVLQHEFPRAKSVSVSRESLLANAVSVVVEERVPYAVWCRSGSCYAIDERGFVFDGSVPSTTSGYVFYGGLNGGEEIIGQTFLPGHLGEVVAFLDALKVHGRTPLGARIENDTDYTVPMAGGYEVRVSFGQDASLLAKNLELMLSSEALVGKIQALSYVDLRFDGRGYYKLKGE